MKQALLVLAHRAYSYIEEIDEVAKSLGFEIGVISSKPANEQREKIIHGISPYRYVTDKDRLDKDDVDRGLSRFQAQGLSIIACIATYEGYRILMADINARISASDSRPDAIRRAMDKLAFRLALYESGVSAVRCERLTPENLEKYHGAGQRKFIKPIRGGASFGTFELTPEVSWNEIERLQRSMKADPDFASVFMNNYDFLVEDYIPGDEYSFEALSHGGKLFVMAVHEKLSLDIQKRYILEPSFISPPKHMSEAAYAQARQKLQSVFAALDLSYGAFHVEARYDGHDWEIIELNTRMGGALVNDSVAIITGGHSLLRLWVELLTTGADHAQVYIDKLARFDDTVLAVDRTSYMRLFFGEPGKTVQRVHVNDIGFLPLKHHCYISTGMVLPDSEREIFAAEAVWKIGQRISAPEIASLVEQCNKFISIEYVSEA